MTGDRVNTETGNFEGIRERLDTSAPVTVSIELEDGEAELARAVAYGLGTDVETLFAAMAGQMLEEWATDATVATLVRERAEQLAFK